MHFRHDAYPTLELSHTDNSVRFHSHHNCVHCDRPLTVSVTLRPTETSDSTDSVKLEPTLWTPKTCLTKYEETDEYADIETADSKDDVAKTTDALASETYDETSQGRTSYDNQLCPIKIEVKEEVDSDS